MNRITKQAKNKLPNQILTDQGLFVPNRVFVGHIPESMTELDLEVAVNDLGYLVQNVRIVTNMRTGRSKGYGFVTFHNVEDANDFLKRKILVWGETELCLDYAVRKKALLQTKFGEQILTPASIPRVLPQSPQPILVQATPFTQSAQSPIVQSNRVSPFYSQPSTFSQPNQNVLVQTVQAPMYQFQSPFLQIANKTVYKPYTGF